MDILNFYYIDLKYIRNLSCADDNVTSDKSCQVLTWIISDFFQGTH